jgi:hypothetical protein
MDFHDNSTTAIILANSNSSVGICRVDFIHFYLSAKGDINFKKFKVRFSFSLDIVSAHDIYIYIYIYIYILQKIKLWLFQFFITEN